MKFQLTLLLLFLILSLFQESQQKSNAVPWVGDEAAYERELLEPGLKANDEFRDELKKLIHLDGLSDTKHWCIVGNLKTYRSLSRKITTDESIKEISSIRKKDFEDITDFIRGTIVVQNEDDIPLIQSQLEKEFDRINPNPKNGKKKNNGYLDWKYICQDRDISIERDTSLPENQGLPDEFMIKMELQMHICPIFMVKEPEHYLYNIVRVLKYVSDQQNFEQLQQATGYNNQNLEHDVKKLYYYFNGIPQFEILRKHLSEWMEDVNNFEKTQKLIQEITNFSNELYQRAYAQYQTEYQSKKFYCDLTFVDNDKCYLDMEEDDDDLRDFAHSLFKEQTLKQKFLKKQRRNNKKIISF